MKTIRNVNPAAKYVTSVRVPASSIAPVAPKTSGSLCRRCRILREDALHSVKGPKTTPTCIVFLTGLATSLIIINDCSIFTHSVNSPSFSRRVLGFYLLFAFLSRLVRVHFTLLLVFLSWPPLVPPIRPFFLPHAFYSGIPICEVGGLTSVPLIQSFFRTLVQYSIKL